MGDPVERIFGRGDIAGAVIGQHRRPVQRIGGGQQPSQRVVGERGGGVGRIERVPRFSQKSLRIVEEPRDLIVGIHDRERVALGIIGDVRLIAFGVRDARDLVKDRFVEERGRGGNALLGAREQIALHVSGQKLFCIPSLEEDNGLRG